MKTPVVILSAWMMCTAGIVQAQSVSSRAPVVAPAHYLTTAAPASGQVVQTYYWPQASHGVVPVANETAQTTPASQQPATTVPAGQQPTTQYYAPPASSVTVLQPTTPQVVTAAPATCPPALPPTTAPAVVYPAPVATTGYVRRYTLRPILPIMNVPAGTYVDRGMLGQPKAYVDGQPVLNFFRYILP